MKLIHTIFSAITLTVRITLATLAIVFIFESFPLAFSIFGSSMQGSRSIQMPETPEGEIAVSYGWSQSNICHGDLTVSIPLNFYEEYCDAERIRGLSNYTEYVTHTGDTDSIVLITAQIEEQANDYQLNSTETVNFTAAFVQQGIDYVTDRISKDKEEYARYPLETLVDGVGDCEDTAILLADILWQLGYDVALLYLNPDDGAAHMALGVGGNGVKGKWNYEHNGTKYYYLETTAKGWELGEIPNKYEKVEAEVYEINSTL